MDALESNPRLATRAELLSLTRHAGMNHHLSKESCIMMHNATKFYETCPATMNAAKARGTEIGKAFGGFFQGLMKEGSTADSRSKSKS